MAVTNPAGRLRPREWRGWPRRVKSNLWPSGSSSLGRARPCQGRGSGFEARLPLQYQTRKKGLHASRGMATTRIVLSSKASASSCSKMPETRRERWPLSAASQAATRSISCASHQSRSTVSGFAAASASWLSCCWISSRRAQNVSQSYSPNSNSRFARSSCSSRRLVAIAGFLRGADVWPAFRRRFRRAECIASVGAKRDSSLWIASSRTSLLNMRALQLGPAGRTAERFRRAAWHP